MKRIEITNLNPYYRIDEVVLRRIVSLALTSRPGNRKSRIGIIILSDKDIRKYNRKYKHRDCSTDVLSFRMDDERSGSEDFYGDILVSADTARKNARVYGTQAAEELARYVLHGVLHLCGYRDSAAREKKRMKAEEERLLNILWKKEDLSKVLTPR